MIDWPDDGLRAVGALLPPARRPAGGLPRLRLGGPPPAPASRGLRDGRGGPAWALAAGVGRAGGVRVALSSGLDARPLLRQPAGLGALHVLRRARVPHRHPASQLEGFGRRLAVGDFGAAHPGRRARTVVDPRARPVLAPRAAVAGRALLRRL